MEYLKIWCSFAEIIEPLNDSERGRLFTAMLEYAERGTLPEFKGNERYIWPAAKQSIDRARDENDRLKANGQQGGRPRKGKTTETNENQTKPTETNENQTKPTETQKEKDKENEKENVNGDGGCDRAGAWISDDEITQAMDRDRQIEQTCRAWGLPCKEGHMIKARDLAREYSLPWLLQAIETAGKGKEQTWRYVEGILKSYREQGGLDSPRRKPQRSPAKVVSAQQYTQRDYTEEELGGGLDAALLAEARAMMEDCG